MEDKFYFITALGDVIGIKDDILSFATSDPRYIESKNVLLCTFSSSISIDDMKSLIEVGKGGVYFISEINDSTFSFSIPNEKHANDLFGNLKKDSINTEEISHEEIGEKIENTSISIFDLIDKGYENLTDEEKDFLNKNS